MFFEVPVLLLVAFGAICGVLGAPNLLSNAERLSRGLPPAPPRFMRRTATRVQFAQRGVSSPLPPVTLSGRLQVRSQENGSPLGNVRNWSGGGTIGTNFLGPDEDLQVTLTYDPSDPTKINILATNPNFPAPFYVGAGTFSSATVPSLSTGSGKSVGFTNVESTPPGAGPTKPPSRDVYVESAIWTVNPTSKKLTPQWINADSSAPSTTLAYDIRNNVLFFTGDISAYNANNPFPASAVDLYLV